MMLDFVVCHNMRPNRWVKSLQTFMENSKNLMLHPWQLEGGIVTKKIQQHQRCIIYHEHPRFYSPRSFRMFQDVTVVFFSC